MVRQWLMQPVWRFPGQAQQPRNSRYLQFLWQLGKMPDYYLLYLCTRMSVMQRSGWRLILLLLSFWTQNWKQHQVWNAWSLARPTVTFPTTEHTTVPHYTASWQWHRCVSGLPGTTLDSTAGENWTHDLSISNPHLKNMANKIDDESMTHSDRLWLAAAVFARFLFGAHGRKLAQLLRR